MVGDQKYDDWFHGAKWSNARRRQEEEALAAREQARAALTAKLLAAEADNS